MKAIDYYMSLPYHMEIIPDKEEGGYTARFPDLPGCLTCAETIEDLVVNAQDAKKAWITAALENGVKIAEPDDISAVDSVSGLLKGKVSDEIDRHSLRDERNSRCEANPYEKSPVSKRIGIAKGKLHDPEDFDAYDEEIEAMFTEGAL